MGWKKDWLYKLIFKEFYHKWKKRYNSLLFVNNTFPIKSYIFEYSNGYEDKASVNGNIFRSWMYNLQENHIKMLNKELPKKLSVSGRYYELANCSFYIHKNRKKVTIQSLFGSLSGESKIYDVIGQGHSGYLQENMEAEFYIF